MFGGTADFGDYRTLCSRVDGMPPLWPRPPRWPFDSALRARYAARLRMPLMLVKPAEEQRIPDMAYRHLMYLLKQHKETTAVATISRPTSEWVALVCGPTGLCAGHLRLDVTPCTAAEFETKLDHHFCEYGFAFAHPYEPPENPIPTFCDVCDKVCTSECGCCGEIFCSRKCMKKNWSQHRRTCETIYDETAALITQMEMREALSEKELCAAFGSKVPTQVESSTLAAASIQSAVRAISEGKALGNCAMCNMPGATYSCQGCGGAIYCNSACQRHDWPVHKPRCTMLTRRKKKKAREPRNNNGPSEARTQADADEVAAALLAELDLEEQEEQEYASSKKGKKKKKAKKRG